MYSFSSSCSQSRKKLLLVIKSLEASRKYFTFYKPRCSTQSIEAIGKYANCFTVSWWEKEDHTYEKKKKPKKKTVLCLVDSAAIPNWKLQCKCHLWLGTDNFISMHAFFSLLTICKLALHIQPERDFVEFIKVIFINFPEIPSWKKKCQVISLV